MFHKYVSIITVFLLFASLSAITERERISMSQLHVDELYFPAHNPDLPLKDQFLWGSTIAEYQASGEENCPNSNWTRWEQTAFKIESCCKKEKKPHIKNWQRSGKSCDHWNQYRQDITLMKNDFNMNAFRFSLSWERIEPQPGQFDEAALQHYSDEVDALLEAGIIPMITLHHFVHPLWFEDAGAFEKEENIAYFVRFAQKVFSVLGHKVPFWCTINEPTIYVFQGYLFFNNVFPPAKGTGWSAWPLAAKVLRNMMQAHTECYRTLKAMPGGENACIGLVHQYLKFRGYSCWNPADNAAGILLDKFMIDMVINFLKTGYFGYGSGFWREEYNASTGKLADFVGLNYYSRPVIEFQWKKLKVLPSCFPGQVMTDMPYPIDAEGFYGAIKHCAEIGIPIYVTENGIADHNETNDTNRVKWIKEYLKVLSLAIEDGYDIRGYFWWTLVDNFEWDWGFEPCFGLYGFDYSTQQRRLKDGSRLYAQVIKASRTGLLTQHTSDYVAHDHLHQMWR